MVDGAYGMSLPPTWTGLPRPNGLEGQKPAVPSAVRERVTASEIGLDHHRLGLLPHDSEVVSGDLPTASHDIIDSAAAASPTVD
jgi:hypothetical protein